MGKVSIHWPSDIDCEIDEGKNTVKVHIRKTDKNMQTNGAAFEAWCLILKANGACESVTLSFEPVPVDPDNYFTNLDHGQQNYMRFLYRLMKFRHQMAEWFFIADSNIEEVDRFTAKFNEHPKTNTIPKGEASFNEDTNGIEHKLEKAFHKFADFRQKAAGINFPLYDQLPNGLFVNEVRKMNRIFNGGDFDLWGVDPSDNKFCLYELKDPKNTGVGVISELYFYANFAYDLLHEQNNIFLNRTNLDENDFRNYKEFLKSKNRGVKAFFLVQNLHPRIQEKADEILVLLNSNVKIAYEIRKYDFEKFSEYEPKLAEAYKSVPTGES